MRALKTQLFFAILVVLLLSCCPAYAQYNNGTIVQVIGDPALYYVINGYAAHIPSIKVFQCMQLERNKKVMITSEQLQSMPKTAFLIEGGDGKIYRVHEQYKRHIPNPQVFKKLKYNDAGVIHIPANQVSCIPDGPPLY